jgi:hypothetical protein
MVRRRAFSLLVEERKLQLRVDRRTGARTLPRYFEAR